MHLGILKADSVRDELQPQFGDYPGMFERLLLQAARDLAFDRQPTFEVFDVQAGQFPQVDACDGYVITGSRDSVYDDQEWIRQLSEFVRVLHEQRKKTVGICFGHQLIAHALGGRTRQSDKGWGVGVHEFRVSGAAPSWMQCGGSSFGLLCSHKDQVEELPPGATILASSDFCPFAAFALEDHFITFQGHPEFNKPYAEALIRFRDGLLGDAKEPALRSLQQSTDEALVAGWMLEFLAGPLARPLAGPLAGP